VNHDYATQKKKKGGRGMEKKKPRLSILRRGSNTFQSRRCETADRTIYGSGDTVSGKTYEREGWEEKQWKHNNLGNRHDIIGEGNVGRRGRGKERGVKENKLSNGLGGEESESNQEGG